MTGLATVIPEFDSSIIWERLIVGNLLGDFPNYGIKAFRTGNCSIISQEKVT
jgi:hypothetical protein